MVKGVTRISISLPDDLRREFDETVEAAGYGDRSKALQIAMRDFISDHKWRGGAATSTGAIVLIYDHEVPGIEEALTSVQHNYKHIVNSTMHLHLEGESCLEIIAVKGRSLEIESLANELVTKKGIKQFKVAVVAI
ncbi:MAG: nickel-responsive transcriptional regulator NikR [Candidatus Bathyarchaeia archaeon]